MSPLAAERQDVRQKQTPLAHVEPIRDVFWRFIRGDLPVSEFEAWLYAQQDLEGLLGASDYLKVISTDFGDSEACVRVREFLEEFTRRTWPSTCECQSVSDLAVIDMGNTNGVLDHFVEVRRRGDPYWWLHLSKCSLCQTPWLVAQEERQNDVFVLRRLSANESEAIVLDHRWPPHFDSYATLLRLGRDAGYHFTFVDPPGSSSLVWTMRDLARESPEMPLAEMAALLNIDIELAEAVAEQVLLKHGVQVYRGDATWQ